MLRAISRAAFLRARVPREVASRVRRRVPPAEAGVAPDSHDGSFTKVTDSIVVNDGTDSWASAWGDYDIDGFLDLFVSNIDGQNFLYHNSGNANRWLEFRLIGTRSNRAAIGAKVRVHATINGQSIWQMLEVSGGDGAMGQNSLFVHVGLGNATTADLVRIEWPSGTVQELQNVASDKFLIVTEPGGEPQLEARVENGQWQLTLTGKQGSRYAIETSTDLATWTSPLTVKQRVPLTGVHENQIEDAVVIEVAPGSPPSVAQEFRDRARGHPGESAAALIVVEKMPSRAGPARPSLNDEQVDKAIVVVITPQDTPTVAVVAPRSLRNPGEDIRVEAADRRKCDRSE